MVELHFQIQKLFWASPFDMFAFLDKNWVQFLEVLLDLLYGLIQLIISCYFFEEVGEGHNDDRHEE